MAGPMFGGFTGLEGNIECQILGGGGGGWSPPSPPSSYAPDDTRVGIHIGLSKVSGG